MVRDNYDSVNIEHSKLKDELLNSDYNSIPDVSNIYVNQIFTGGRRRSDMVRAVGWKPYNWQSNQGRAQEKRLRQYFQWEDDKVNKTLIITKIYDNPKDREDGRYVSMYGDFINFLLMNKLLLKYNQCDKFSTTLSGFFKGLGAVSSDFKKIRNSLYLNNFGIKSDDLNVVRGIIELRFIPVIKRHLKRLYTKDIIDITHNQMIILDDHTLINSKDYYTLLNKQFGAEDVKAINYLKLDNSIDEQIRNNLILQSVGKMFIDNASNYACNELKIANEREAIINNKMLAYKEICNRYVQQHYKWKGIYKSVDIDLLCSKEEADSFLKQNKFYGSDVDTVRKMLNNFLVNKIDETFDRKLKHKKISESLAAIKDIIIGNEFVLPECKAKETEKRINKGFALLNHNK